MVPAASRFMRDTMSSAESQAVNGAAPLALMEQNRPYNYDIPDTCFGAARGVGSQMKK